MSASDEEKTLRNMDAFLKYATPNHIWNDHGGYGMSTLFALLAQTSSVFVPLFMILQSVMDFDWKGVFYVSCLALSTLIYKMFTKYAIPKQINENQASRRFVTRNDYLCNMYTLPFFRNYTNGDGDYVQNQSVSTFVLVFTLAFVISPMVELKDYNWGFVLVLMVLILLNVCWGIYHTCTNFIGVITSLLFGSILGVICYAIFKELGWMDSPIYFNRQSGMNTCKVRGKVKYTCDFDDPDDKEYIIS